jgi:hypothetical protein
MGDPKRGKQISKTDVFAFLVVLRISPVPPHWVANFVAPHLGKTWMTEIGAIPTKQLNQNRITLMPRCGARFETSSDCWLSLWRSSFRSV